MRPPRAVIVGAGQAGFQAACSLRQLEFPGEVVLLSDEAEPPYARPPLSKELLKDGATADTVGFRPAAFYPDKDIELACGDPVVSIDRNARRVRLASGTAVGYDRLVIASGSRPRALPVPGSELDGVVSLRTVSDAVQLRARLETGRALVVIGGGFIGLEVAATACERALEVTVLEVLERTMARVVSPVISDHVAGVHRGWGVDVRHRARAARFLAGAGRAVAGVELEDGSVVPADIVLVGVGVVPNIELARDAGLETGDGILVDEHLRTRDPSVWAIGDCAAFPWRGQARRRLESVQNAADQARTAAAGIAGDPRPYRAVPWFWSYQNTCKLQIAGLIGSCDTTVLRADPISGSFSVFAFAGERLLGVESVNRPADRLAARKLLDAEAPLDPARAADPEFDLAGYAARQARPQAGALVSAPGAGVAG